MLELWMFVRLFIGFTFLYAAIPKLRNLRWFTAVIAEYRIVPLPLTQTVAAALAGTELLIAVAFLSGWQTRIVGSVAASLLVTFSAAVAVNLRRGKVIDCGCGGWASSEIASELIANDLFLATLCGALVIAPPPSLASLVVEREIDLVGFLAFAICAGIGPILVAAIRAWRDTVKSARRLEASLGGPR